ncbi:hypothetical protein Nepgr_011259 [Nepenthes gracilis]|uniref:MHD1 domain-containing protein n=1 Tax=Nepenthes gracilis TaxID=150966 RepID=A0AAD3XLT1_NEPGR|nr:hypothetical protein Nepgr_011259 [Nepenthes gracilis]
MDSSMLERYRRDRQKLLEFIISSSNSIREVRTPSGSTSISNINLDTVSADYVLSCIKSGGVLDVSEGTKNYFYESAHPITIHSQSGNSYFVLSDPNVSGSPPRRMPPPIDVSERAKHSPQSSSQVEQTLKEKIAVHHEKESRVKHANGTVESVKPAEVGGVPPLGLPPLKSGLSDDDLWESAYEILLASMVFSGIRVLPDQGRKKGKSSKLLSGLNSKEDKVLPQSPSQEIDFKLIDTIRIQMQVSEAMDLCIRQLLVQHTSKTSRGQISVPHISLMLIYSISRSNFFNDKSYIRWNSRQASILEELLGSANHSATNCAAIRYSIGNIRNAMEWDVLSPTERAEILVSIRDSVSEVLSFPGGPGQCSIKVESGYEATGYHLRIRLYEKLLLSVFDILEEGQLLAEADKILKLIELAWSTLGITQIIHDALYAWVLLKQFVRTDEQMLLEKAILQVQKVFAADPCNEEEGRYLNYLLCTSDCNGRVIQSSLLPAIFFSMSIWCDRMLQDYHMHYSQKPSEFRRMLTLALAVGVFVPNEYDVLMELNTSSEMFLGRLKTYIESSVQAAYIRVADCSELKYKLKGMHTLVILANNLKLIAEKESAVFFPALYQWCPEAGKISATLLYQRFGERLKPYLQDICSLSQDVRLVLAAAHMLDLELTQLNSLACEGNGLSLPLNCDLDHYQIAEVARPVILDWVIAQHAHILDWIGRAFDLEDWEPLSSQQKQAVSVIEAFRMINETVDQFFALNLPVNITHLQGLLSLIIHSLDAYSTKVVDQLVEKSHLYPSAPSLTRYKEAVVPVARKKPAEPAILGKEVNAALNGLTISKLCIRLNTLQYMRNQIGVLENSIRKSWGLIKVFLKRRWFNIAEEKSPKMSERTMSACDETVDELFVTTFDVIRNTVSIAMDKIFDFIGAKVVFWDLRESFIFYLYRVTVEGARMDSVLQHVDVVLKQICDLVDDIVRDPVVLSIFHMSLEGYIWILLDGGPSRAFSDSDITLMEDDLNILKDFFVADGEGLPRSLVEQEAAFAHKVLSLFSRQTGSVIQMLLTASESISTWTQSHRLGHRSLDDANTLIRVLCHKKDREASKFLKRQYHLPVSSDYDDAYMNESTSSSAVISDLLKRGASFRWSSTNDLTPSAAAISDLLKRSASVHWIPPCMHFGMSWSNEPILGDSSGQLI